MERFRRFTLVLLILVGLLCALPFTAECARGRILISEPDGDPNKKPVYEIEVPNGSASVDAGIGTITIDAAVGPAIASSAEKVTIVDADRIAGLNSESSNALTWWTWANFKTWLTTYFDTLYFSVTGYVQVDTEAELTAAIAAATPKIVARADITLTAPRTLAAGQTYSALSGAVITPDGNTFDLSAGHLEDNGGQMFSVGVGTEVVFGTQTVDVLRPRIFGATGDYATDDTAEVQAALTASLGIIPVHIPSGGYVITVSLTLPQAFGGRALLNSMVYGDGLSTVLINAAPAGNPTFKDTGTIRGLVLKNMSLVGKTANPNKGMQFAVIESSQISNISMDMYGDGIYVTNHAMDVKFEHLYFWWDILSDVLGYTTAIRYNSLVQGFSAIKICDGEVDGGTYWANHVLFDNIWTNGGAYGINSTPRTSLMLRVVNSGFDAWAAADGSSSGHNVAILLKNAYRSVVRDCYINSNMGTASNRLMRLVNCRNVTVASVHDDKYDPTETVSKNTSSVEISGSSTDNIVLRDIDSSGAPDIQTDVEAYAAVTMEGCRFTGGFTTANRNAFYMSEFYAKNLYIKTVGIAGSGVGYINTSPLTNSVFSVTNGSSSQDNIAVGSAVTVVFGTEIIDYSANFASNSFTAAGFGLYQLNALIRLTNLDTAASLYVITIVTSNRNYPYYMTPSQFAADVADWQVSFSVLADMDAADTAYVTVEQTGGSQQTDIEGGSYFSGILAK